MSEPSHAVIYAAKSTEDKHGSIPTQIEDCKALTNREDWTVVGQEQDEARSAFHGNRGPGLERAKVLAVATAAEHGSCVLVAQDSDRFARGGGDAEGAADHLAEVFFAMRRRGVMLWTVRSGELDTLRAVLEGERGHDESSRKTQAVRAGLLRRKERGKPVGAVPLGYTVKKKVLDGEKIVSRRVIDPATAATVERIFALVESGSTFGEVARTLNAEGIRTRPRKDNPEGTTWVSRTVSKIVYNRTYAGEKGYPKIIEPDRFDDIHKGLKRLDPVQVAKRQGGRKPADDSYFLRGIASCSVCGSTLYTRRQAIGRVYVCANRHQGTGVCHAPPIPAEVIESHVLRHLDVFVGSVEGWIAGRVEERSAERQQREASLERDKALLRDLERQRERQMSQYRKLDAEGVTAAYIVLEEVERIDRERSEQQRRIEDGEANVSEWSGPPDVDAALDFYTALVDQVQGRIAQAKGARELNEALSMVVTGLWAEIEEDRERLLVEFELVGIEQTLLAGAPDPFSQRPTLPPRLLDDRFEPEPLTQTRTQTNV